MAAQVHKHNYIFDLLRDAKCRPVIRCQLNQLCVCAIVFIIIIVVVVVRNLSEA